MLKPFLSFAAVVFCVAAQAQLPTDYRATIEQLGKSRHQHPYLLFSAEEKPAMMARIQADQHDRESYEALLLEGRRLLNATVDSDDAPVRELHTRYLGADDYRRFVTRHLDAAFTLAFLYQTTGDQRYVAKAFEHANVVCAQDSWVQSAHMFDVIYPRVWPFGARDDQVAFTYDITASGTSQRMAYIYDWLYTGLAKPQRDRIRGALLEKSIMRVRGNYEYLWWATAYKCNWSGICHTGLGLSALTLLDEDPQLVDVVARSCEGINGLLDHIGEDGGWQEGRGYWAYGLGESLRFIDAIKRLTEGKIDLYKHRALATHPVDFALFGLTGGFGDGSGAPVGESFMLNRLVQEAGDPVGAWYVKNFVRSRRDIFDLIWPATTVQPQKPADGSKFFRSIDWAALRKDFDADSVTITTKAGMNNDPHHGHLDCGTFNLTWQGLTFVGEVPRTPYDEKYFGAMRWDYLEARTNGHNCVLVNGEEQICAKLKDQPWREDIGGHITFFTSEPTWAAVAMDPTRAYPGKELQGWNRWIVLDKDTNIVVVVDKVRCAPGATIEVRFHPSVELDVRKDHVVLRAAARMTAEDSPRARRNPSVANRERLAPRMGVVQLERGGGRNSGGATRSDLEMVPMASSDFTLIQGEQPDLPITEDAQTTWVPYFSTTVKAPTADNVIVSVFCPADLRRGDGAFAGKLEGSAATPGFSYTVHGKTTKLSFALDRITREAQ
jgi:hypothetical protein